MHLRGLLHPRPFKTLLLSLSTCTATASTGMAYGATADIISDARRSSIKGYLELSSEAYSASVHERA